MVTSGACISTGATCDSSAYSASEMPEPLATMSSGARLATVSIETSPVITVGVASPRSGCAQGQTA
ncbi:hypothetical protein PVT71_28150 (plasmid) [Salipiger sp. H15]|uniref:Uncharacterized protein n=1 Tax=Alloyangia sp. H15 TaxID=3029062 RepID=A0AAU8ARY7_9RHOB